MEHLSMLMWIKVHYNQNTFTILEFSKFTMFGNKISLRNFKKGKNCKRPSEIQTQDLQIYS